MKQNPQNNITRYHKARLIGFAWNKAASMGDDVSAFESTGIYPLNRNRVLEYFLSISDTRETVTFMETAPPDMAPICAPLLHEPTLYVIYFNRTFSTLNTTLPSDTSPEEVTLSRLFKFSLVPKIPRKYSISEKQLFVPSEERNNTEEIAKESRRK
jgi:hypothetical protein